jgi:hypothetical protein
MPLPPLAAQGSPLGLFVVAIVGVACAWFCLWYFGRDQRLKRRLRRTPACPISALGSDTPGRVVGTARTHRETLEAPLTGRECLYYEVEVTEKRGKHTRRVLREVEGVEFVVDDGSGRALVDPRTADVVLDVDGSSSSGTFHDANPAEEALLARHGVSSTGWVFNKSLRYRESIIGVGEQVAALACSARGSTGGPRLVAPPDGRIVISDSRSTTSNG